MEGHEPDASGPSHSYAFRVLVSSNHPLVAKPCSGRKCVLVVNSISEWLNESVELQIMMGQYLLSTPLLIQLCAGMHQGELRRYQVPVKDMLGWHNPDLFRSMVKIPRTQVKKNHFHEILFLDVLCKEIFIPDGEIPIIDLKVINSIEGVKKEVPILFMHGWPDDEYVWKYQVDFFIKRGYTCMAYTLPWFGSLFEAKARANKFGYKREGYSLESTIDGIALAVYKLYQGDIYVVGHDWGAFHAQYFKARHPKMVGKLVILDVGSRIVEPPSFSAVPAAIAMGLAYQYTQIFAWWLSQSRFSALREKGEKLATRQNHWAKTTQIPKRFQVKLEDYSVSGSMGHHYAELQKVAMLAPFGIVDPLNMDPNAINNDLTDMLFIYGNKPGRVFKFHEDSFVARLNATDDLMTARSCAAGINCGHWVPIEAPEDCSKLIQMFIENGGHFVSEAKAGKHTLTPQIKPLLKSAL